MYNMHIYNTFAIVPSLLLKLRALIWDSENRIERVIRFSEWFIYHEYRTMYTDYYTAGTKCAWVEKDGKGS